MTEGELWLSMMWRSTKALDAAANELGWEPIPGRFHLFAVDIDQITFISYDPVAESQHVAMWPPGREFMRPHDTATSLGDPEPVSDSSRPASLPLQVPVDPADREVGDRGRVRERRNGALENRPLL